MKSCRLNLVLTLATLASLPLSAEENLTALAEELLERSPPTPDWRPILEARIKSGEPLPELPEAFSPPSDQSDPADLLAYWRSEWSWRDGAKPTDAVRAKILEAVQKEPSAIPEVLEALPPGEAAAKIVLGLLDQIPGISHEDEEGRRKVRAWIFRESGLLKEKVLADAPRANWKLYLWDERTDPTLDALQQRVPEEARVIFENFVRGDTPGLKALGVHLLLKNATPKESERLRLTLQRISGDLAIPLEARQLAVQFLLSSKWPGREEWVIETLKKKNPGDINWFVSVVAEDPDHWIPLLVGFLENENRSLHDHAVYLLAQFHLEASRVNALRPLLPWLMDEKWSSAGEMERLRLIQSVDAIEIPEAVEGLRHVVRTEEDQAILAYASEGLAHYKAREAIPDLKKSLERCDDRHYREKIIRSIDALGGYSHDEKLAGLLACFREMPTSDDRWKEFTQGSEVNVSVQAHLGLYLVERMPSNLDDDFFRAVRDQLEKSEGIDETMAGNLRQFLVESGSAVSREMMANGLLKGNLSVEELVLALEKAREDSWRGDTFQPLLEKGGAAAGFAAVLSRDKEAMFKVLKSDDDESKLALLAAARLTRDHLPVERVGGELGAKRKDLAKAALAFLRESRDPEARDFIEMRLADPTVVTGAKIWRYFDELEQELGGEFQKKEDLVEIFGLLSSGTWGDDGQWYVFVYRDHAEAVRDFGWGRFGKCRLTKAQLGKLQAYVRRYKVDDLPPLTLPIDDGLQMSYVHATPNGMRRVFMNNPPTSRESVKEYSKNYGRGVVLYAQLVNLFTDLFEELELKLQYGPDVEILVPSEVAQIKSVWKEGTDLRVLVENSEQALHWQRANVITGDLLGPVDEPPGCEVMDTRAHLHPDFEIQSEYHFRHPWQIQSGDAVVHPGEFEGREGLWICRRNKKPELLAKGAFLSQLVSDDGKWCVAAYAPAGHWASPNTVVRINLETKELFPIALEPADNFDTRTFVRSHGNFLITRQADREDGGDPPVGPTDLEAHLLDPATGKLQKVDGDFLFFGRNRFRPMQATGEVDVFWAADSGIDREGRHGTVVGRYNSKHFSFEPVRKIYGIIFDDTSMWIDEKGGVIYAAVNQDLVRIPLKAK